jgi:anthranilate synthase component 1
VNEYKNAVLKAKNYIKAGDIIQTVISQRFSTETKIDKFDIYRALRIINPSPYMYYLGFGDTKIIGASPEIFVKVEGKKVSSRPIAGTRKRDADNNKDILLEKELLNDPKEKAEHIMLVDLARNDLGRVCTYGTVKVDELMAIERYSHVMHIVSNVTGRLRDGKTTYDVIRACFPAGTLSGAPKVRAMEIIDELENTRRGSYGGLIGYFSFTGNLDSCIAIRTMVCIKDKIYFQAGAGIVADSDPLIEYHESMNKAKPILEAISMAGKGL